MPLKKFDHGNWKWLALLILAPAAMMLVTSGRRKPHSKGYLTKDDGRDESSQSVQKPSTPPPPPPAASPTSSIWTTGMLPSSMAPSSSASSASSAMAPGAVDLSSPKATVETQLRLLQEGKDDELRKTFLPSVGISADQLDACKKKIASSVVKPDWEMAEEEVVNGHRVRRVSMFGKSMTGFHDIGGKWLADALWCLPVGVP